MVENNIKITRLKFFRVEKKKWQIININKKNNIPILYMSTNSGLVYENNVTNGPLLHFTNIHP